MISTDTHMLQLKDTIDSYIIVWKYKVNEVNKGRFELEYGHEGTWFKLFSQSKAYRGSFLYKSEDEADVYLLIDTWTDRKSYENFKEQHSVIYHELSKKFEVLYESEYLLGTFCKPK